MYVCGVLVIFTILALGVGFVVRSSLRVDPLVRTPVGSIRGLRATDGEYSKFMGIPYARVQENNHFGSSTPYPPFEDTFFAQHDTSICPQIEDETGNAIGDIDCLHLNVYVPDTASSMNKVPVMVYIHGGTFVAGDKRKSNFGPKFLVKHDVILVVINYRLGAYGFMCMDDPRVPGNQGLKDQILALRWIKDNIEAFGGDVDKITLSGESAGAVAVNLHTLIYKEALFDKAIIQSGTANAPWVINEPNRNASFEIAAALGFEGGDIEEALSYLSSLNSNEVVTKVGEMGIGFSPCVENKFENVDIFIETDPINMKSREVRNIPILIGTNSDELTYLYHGVDMKDVGDLFRERLEPNFAFEEDKLKAMSDIVRQFYIGDEEITDAVGTAIIDFDSDFLFQHPTQRAIKDYLENDRKVFYYVFSYVGKRNFLREVFGLSGGACHADELGYLFDIDILPDADEADQLMIDRMTTLWTNFIKFGDPTPEPTDLLPKWTPVTEGRMDYLSLDSQVQMKSRPFKERLALWELFYDTNTKMQKGYNENV